MINVDGARFRGEQLTLVERRSGAYGREKRNGGDGEAHLDDYLYSKGD